MRIERAEALIGIVCLFWGTVAVPATAALFLSLSFGGTGAALWPALWSTVRMIWLCGFALSIAWLMSVRCIDRRDGAGVVSDPYWWAGFIFSQLFLVIGSAVTAAGRRSGFPWMDFPSEIWIGFILGQAVMTWRWLIFIGRRRVRTSLELLPVWWFWFLILGLIGSLWLPMRGALQELSVMLGVQGLIVMIGGGISLLLLARTDPDGEAARLAGRLLWVIVPGIVAALNRGWGGPWPFILEQIGATFRLFWVLPGVLFMAAAVWVARSGRTDQAGARVGLMLFAVYGLLMALTGIGAVRKWVHLTWAEVTLDLLCLYVVPVWGLLVVSRDKAEVSWRTRWQFLIGAGLVVPMLAGGLTGLWHGIMMWSFEQPWTDLVGSLCTAAAIAGWSWLAGIVPMIRGWGLCRQRWRRCALLAGAEGEQQLIAHQHRVGTAGDRKAEGSLIRWMMLSGLIVLALWSCTVGVAHRLWGSLEPEQEMDGLRLYPEPLSGRAERGAELYVQLGCVECHTRMAVPPPAGPDRLRGWMKRPSVLRDYLYDRPPLLGWIRIGPDLACYGSRVESLLEVIRRLWRAHGEAGGSGLVRVDKLFFQAESPSQARWIEPMAMMLVPESPGRPGVYVTEEGVALAEYLRSSRQDAVLPETVHWSVRSIQMSTSKDRWIEESHQ